MEPLDTIPGYYITESQIIVKINELTERLNYLTGLVQGLIERFETHYHPLIKENGEPGSLITHGPVNG